MPNDNRLVNYRALVIRTIDYAGALMRGSRSQHEYDSVRHVEQQAKHAIMLLMIGTRVKITDQGENEFVGEVYQISRKLDNPERLAYKVLIDPAHTESDDLIPEGMFIWAYPPNDRIEVYE